MENKEEKAVSLAISFLEPQSARYIYINPQTNKVHLLVPLVGGQEISTDNTCRAEVTMKHFFETEGLIAINQYIDALERDIDFLAEKDPIRLDKEERHRQMLAYRDALLSMQDRTIYRSAADNFKGRKSNLYGMQLRPKVQDSLSSVINPAFSVTRTNDDQGRPLSSLYNAIHRKFPQVFAGARNSPRTELIGQTLKALPKKWSLAQIQNTLAEQCKALFGLSIDFTKSSDQSLISKEYIDELMGFDGSEEPKEYIDVLLNMCAKAMWEEIPSSPFYNMPAFPPGQEDSRTEALSILTQFFLANLTIYCKIQGISEKNFGLILDRDPALSNALIDKIARALSNGEEVEKAIVDFFNVHQSPFRLNRPLDAMDFSALKQKFFRTYRTVTATNENPHMDDFLILDTEAKGENALCVSHQGSICVNFAEIALTTSPYLSAYFQQIRQDFTTHPLEIPHKNASVPKEIKIDPEAMVKLINDPQTARNALTILVYSMANLIKNSPKKWLAIIQGIDNSPEKKSLLQLITWIMTEKFQNNWNGLHMMAYHSPEALLALIQRIDDSVEGKTLLRALINAMSEKNEDNWTGLYMMAFYSQKALFALIQRIDNSAEGMAILQAIARAMTEKNKSDFNGLAAMAVHAPDVLLAMIQRIDNSAAGKAFLQAIAQTMQDSRITLYAFVKESPLAVLATLQRIDNSRTGKALLQAIDRMMKEFNGKWDGPYEMVKNVPPHALIAMIKQIDTPLSSSVLEVVISHYSNIERLSEPQELDSLLQILSKKTLKNKTIWQYINDNLPDTKAHILKIIDEQLSKMTPEELRGYEKEIRRALWDKDSKYRGICKTSALFHGKYIETDLYQFLLKKINSMDEKPQQAMREHKKGL